METDKLKRERIIGNALCRLSSARDNVMQVEMDLPKIGRQDLSDELCAMYRRLREIRDMVADGSTEA